MAGKQHCKIDQEDDGVPFEIRNDNEAIIKLIMQCWITKDNVDKKTRNDHQKMKLFPSFSNRRKGYNHEVKRTRPCVPFSMSCLLLSFWLLFSCQDVDGSSYSFVTSFVPPFAPTPALLKRQQHCRRRQQHSIFVRRLQEDNNNNNRIENIKGVAINGTVSIPRNNGDSDEGVGNIGPFNGLSFNGDSNNVNGGNSQINTNDNSAGRDPPGMLSRKTNWSRNLYEYAKAASGTLGDIMSGINDDGMAGATTRSYDEQTTDLSSSVDKRDGLVTTTIPSGTLEARFGIDHPLDRMALTANGNLQRLVSSYYDAPVQVIVDTCELLKDGRDDDTIPTFAPPAIVNRPNLKVQAKRWDRVVHLTVHNQVCEKGFSLLWFDAYKINL